jgi:type II secretion system protein N
MDQLAMKKKIKRPLRVRILRWIIFWVILPFVILYAALLIWNPGDTFMRNIFKKIEDQTGISITYSSAKITPLGAIRFKELLVEQKADKDWQVAGRTITLQSRRYFSAETCKIGLAVTPFLKGLGGLSFNADAYGGKIYGVVEAPLLDKSAPLHLLPNWEGISIARLKKDYPDLGVESGISKGSANLLLNQSGGQGMNGEVQIAIEDFEYRVSEQMAGALNIHAISRINGRIELKEKQIEFTDFWAYGDLGAIQIKGTILQDPIPDNSKLDLEIRIHSQKPGEPINPKEYLPLKVTGTAGDPLVDFMGMTFNKNQGMFSGK